MLCHKPQLLGMVRVVKADVVNACNRTLNRIYKYRSEHRRLYVENYLANFWNTFWRFGKKPTRKDALRSYYYSNSFPPYFDAIMSYGEQEDKCKKILNAAYATNAHSMMITTDGISACRLSDV